jgi:hypothetical protein
MLDTIEGLKDRPQQAALLLLSFIIPVQPLLQISQTVSLLKTYRLVEVVLIAMTGLALIGDRRPHQVPSSISISFWVGLAGWILATTFSEYPKQSLDTGVLEFLLPFCVLYLFLRYAPDRDFMLTACGLFVLGALLESIVQTWFIVSAYRDFAHVRHSPELLLFPDASNFLFYKSSIPTVLSAGIPFSYGNPDNYVSLWVLLVSFTAGSLFFIRRRWIAAIALFALIYFGLFVYSRSGLIVIFISLTSLLAFRYFSAKSTSKTIIAALTVLVLIHVSRSSIAYYSEGIAGFASTIESSSSVPPVDRSSEVPAPATSRNSLERDNEHSGQDRATAWAKGLDIGINHWLTGIGYGVYPIIEPDFTAPHTMLLMRFAESGIFGLISFSMLAMYAPARLVGMLRDRRADIFNVTCLVAVSAFMLKAIFFGASFSISSNIVWGYGVMMVLAASKGKKACTDL